MNGLEPPSTPLWVDMHCHLDLQADHAGLIAECDRERVATLAVTTTPKAWRRNRALAAGSRHVRAALGLHPQLVAERAGELALLEAYMPEARYVGEVGLDAGPRFRGSLEAQERAFERVLRGCAEQGGKILSVHSVRAVGRTLRQIERHLPPERGRVVLHWFTGTASEARRAVELGCYFSVNAAMLEVPRGRALVAGLPIGRLLTETDGPFVRIGGTPARPRDVAATISMLASIRGTSARETQAAVLNNLRALLTG